MSKFIIKEDFWEIFPEAEIFIVTAKGINNSAQIPEIVTLLKEANKEALKYLTEENFTDNPPVKVWREAYTKFKTKKGARCSLEALLKRIDKGGEIGTINPLVDLYNSVSLKFALPCGGEDLDTFDGDLLLTKAIGGESFMALGDEEDKPALPEEVIYKDNTGAVCRCWNWRDGQRTMLTENTKNAFLIIESVGPSRKEDGLAAVTYLKESIEKFMGGQCQTYYMNIDNKEIEL